MSATQVLAGNGGEVVSVLIVDDHPALRAGLEGLLAHAAGFSFAGALASERDLAATVARDRPDVVLLDYALEHGDGLSACFRLKQLAEPPGVVLYSAYVDRLFAVPATLAQADGIVSKTAPVDELLRVVHDVARGERHMPPLDHDAMDAALARLAADDLAVAGMLLARVEVASIASTLGLSDRAVRSRSLRIIGELQAPDRIGQDEAIGELQRVFG